MTSERLDQMQMKILKVLIIYVFIQMIILAMDRSVNRDEDTNYNTKTRNSTKKIRHSAFFESVNLPVPKRSVQNVTHVYCNYSYKVYNNLFVVLSNVILDPAKCSRVRKGGENVSEILNQNEKDEYCKVHSGFLKLSCDRKPPHTYPDNRSHFKQWDASIEIGNTNTSENYAEGNVTLAIVRQDYANLYWVIVDIYDIYHVAHFLNLDITKIEILIVDTHPSTPLDTLWSKLFPNVSRIGHLSEKVFYPELVWGMRVADSPLLKRKPSKELFLPEFKNFVLSKISQTPKNSTLNCNNITITIVFRRDYVAHPRNPSGKVKRKMSNDLELLKNISNMYKGHNVRGVQLDLLSTTEQIQLAFKTDILVGMHGAGLSHVIFLPSHAVLVELFPLSYSRTSHFEFIAKWRNLRYAMWQNKVKSREIHPGTTTVDISAIGSLINTVYEKMCKEIV